MSLLPLTETLGDTTISLRDGRRARLEIDHHPEGGWVARAAFDGTHEFVQANGQRCGTVSREALLKLVPGLDARVLNAAEAAGRNWEAGR